MGWIKIDRDRDSATLEQRPTTSIPSVSRLGLFGGWSGGRLWGNRVEVVDIEPCFVPLGGFFDQDAVHGDVFGGAGLVVGGVSDGDHDVLTVNHLTKDAVAALDSAVAGGFSAGELRVALSEDLALEVALASDKATRKVGAHLHLAAIEPRGGFVGDKELATVGVGTRVRHAQDAGLVVLEVGMELVFKPISRAACSVSKRTACLDHKAGDDAVENTAIIEGAVVLHLAAGRVFPSLGACGKGDKVSDGFGDTFGKELRDDRAFGSVDHSPRFFGGVGGFFVAGPRCEALRCGVGQSHRISQEQAKPK